MSEINVEDDPQEIEGGMTEIRTTGREGHSKVYSSNPDVVRQLIENEDFEPQSFLVFERREMATHTLYVDTMEEAAEYDGVYVAKGILPTAEIEQFAEHIADEHTN